MPNIPNILINGEFVSNFSEKTELFNSDFASPCTPIVSNNKLPSLPFKTNQRLENKTFTDDDTSLIRNATRCNITVI